MTHIRKVEEGSGFHASVDWIMAGLFVIAAAAAPVYFPAPLVFDTNSPDFNPFGFLPLVLGAVALRYAIPALRATMRSRRFGRSVMEMDGQTVAPGGTLTGVVRVPADLAPLGDYELRLQCIQQTRSTSANSSLKDEIRGEQTLRVSATVDPRGGIPFTFRIPTDAMTTADPDVRTDASVRWILEVKAPLRGMDFYALFGVEVRAGRRA